MSSGASAASKTSAAVTSLRSAIVSVEKEQDELKQTIAALEKKNQAWRIERDRLVSEREQKLEELKTEHSRVMKEKENELRQRKAELEVKEGELQRYKTELGELQGAVRSERPMSVICRTDLGYPLPEKRC